MVVGVLIWVGVEEGVCGCEGSFLGIKTAFNFSLLCKRHNSLSDYIFASSLVLLIFFSLHNFPFAGYFALRKGYICIFIFLYSFLFIFMPARTHTRTYDLPKVIFLISVLREKPLTF